MTGIIDSNGIKYEVDILEWHKDGAVVVKKGTPPQFGVLEWADVKHLKIN